MAAIGFCTAIHRDRPQSLGESFSNWVEEYCNLNGRTVHLVDQKMIERNDAQSFLLSALKVISYVILALPAFVLRACLRAIYPIQSDLVQQVVAKTPPFNGYKIGNWTLTSMPIRPANLFFRALGLETTMPGSKQLFAFYRPHDQIARQIGQRDPNQVISFSAPDDLKGVYGDATYRMSCGELQQTLASQKIYLSPKLPRWFYQGLKEAMAKDGIVILPYARVGALQGKHCRAFLAQVPLHLDLLNLSMYQLGAMVVKTEDFRIFMDSDGKIKERNPGAQDAIRLINACGIRDFRATDPQESRAIMTNTFRTALHAAESGFVVFPAVGMGVWEGDPEVYWKAFLDAVAQSGNQLERVLVNPGHESTPRGRYKGCSGNEFQQILDEYRVRYAQNPQALANLDKIDNLYEKKTDVIHLAHQLKVAFPNKIVSLFNASDPDVTLGYHVGEYVNDLNHGKTTEENYTAMGTNGICFEGITRVHNDPNRIIQAAF